MTATQLRKDVYRVIDRVVKTGIPAEITCRGQEVFIVSKEPRSRLSRLKKRPILKCKPQEILSTDGTGTWKPFI